MLWRMRDMRRIVGGVDLIKIDTVGIIESW